MSVLDLLADSASDAATVVMGDVTTTSAALWEDAAARAAHQRPNHRSSRHLDNSCDAIVQLLATWISGSGLISLPDTGTAPVEAGLCPDGAASCALIQMTSGSTGTPKGVHLTLDAIGHNVNAIMERVDPGPGEVVYSWLPLSHDMGLIGLCLASLVAIGHEHGGTLIIGTPRSFAIRPMSWASAVSELGVTITGMPNFALELVTRRIAKAPSNRYDLRTLRSCILGAEPIRARTLRAFVRAAAPLGFSSGALCPAYGQAETALAATMVAPSEPWRSLHVDCDALKNGELQRNAGEQASVEVVSCGRPLRGIQMTVAGGDVGELQVRSPSLFSHYGGSAESGDGDGSHATGDIGFVDGDEVFVVGRKDELLKVAGRFVVASIVEDAATAVAGVAPGSAAAVQSPDGGIDLLIESRGTLDNREVTLAIARATGVSPAHVVTVPPRHLPRTSTGKLCRGAVLEAVVNTALHGEVPHDRDV